MPISPASALVARWNATYPPGTPVTVRLPGKTSFHGVTFAEAQTSESNDEERCVIAVEQERDMGRHMIYVGFIEHRAILPSETTAAMLALGMPPLEELGDPEPPVNLRDISHERWQEAEDRWLVIPHAIAGYIERLTAPPTEDQIEHIERHIGEYHGLPPVYWRDGMPWLVSGAHDAEKRAVGDLSPTAAEWVVKFSFAHRFITGTAQLCRQ